MPVIQFPGYTKDPFGGPAGGTQQMFAALLSSYMKTQEEQKKREQEKLLAELLAGGGRPQQLPGMDDPTGPVTNPPTPAGGYDTQPEDYPALAQSILSNPSLDIRQKIQGVGMVTAMKELEPVAAKVRQTKIEWWDKEGKPHIHYAAEGTENAVIADLEARGMSVGKIEQPKVPSDDIVEIEAYQQQFEKGSPQWNSLEKRKAEIRAREARVGRGEGSGKTPEDLRKEGRVQVGESWYSPAELRGFWKAEYQILDQDDPAYWQLTESQQRAMDERVQQAPKLSDFVNQARRQGYIPGTGPITSSPGQINKEAAQTPVDDETAKRERMGGEEATVPTPKNVKNPEQFKQLMATPEGKALRQVGWPGNRQPTAAEVAKARALIQSKQVR